MLTISNELQSDSAAFLSKPRGVVETADGLIHVLDSDWKAVFVYRSDGSYMGRIGDGYGLRPGQFALPVDMAQHDGVLYVLDYELQRVTMFGLDGQLRGTLGWEDHQARFLAVSSEGIWLRFMFPERRHWGGLFDLEGELQRLVFPIHVTDTAFADFGLGGAIEAVRGAEAVRYAHGSGAFVQTTSKSASARAVITPQPLPRWIPLRDWKGVPERIVYGMVAWADWFLELTANYSGAPQSSLEEMTVTYGISVYDSSGALLGESTLPDGDVLGVDPGTDEQSIFVSYMTPPKVMKLVLELSGDPTDLARR
jgi:hypothetical protein